MKEGACDNDRRFEQLGEHLLGEGLFVCVCVCVDCDCFHSTVERGSHKACA